MSYVVTLLAEEHLTWPDVVYTAVLLGFTVLALWLFTR